MSPALAPLLPWTDRAGRLSGLKLAVFCVCVAPMLWLVFLLATGNAGSKALTYAIHDTGDWAVRFLLLTLLVTPLRTLAGWPKLILVRRMLGLAALGYALAHLLFYVAEQGYDIPKVVSEIIRRFYLNVGIVALAGLVVLGITSTDGMIRRLGSAAWNRLHLLVYPLTLLALWHFALQRKLEVTETVLMTGFFFWLMGWRLLRRVSAHESLAALAGLAVSAALLTALVEAAWYAAMTGVMASRVLAANLDWSFEIRPAWWVLATGAVLTLIHAWRGSNRAGRAPALAPAPGRN